MSVAEDTELRDLVSQTLEKNGTLAQVRATLRASVFLALEGRSAETESSFVNRELKEFLTKVDSALSLCLIREFLEYLQLDSTLAIFNTETHHGKDYEYKGRSMLAKDLHLEKFKDKKGPLLPIIIQLALESLGSSNSPLVQRNEEHQAGDFETNTIQSPKSHIPSNISYAETSNASLEYSQNLLNETFTTGVLVTSFGSPDTSLDKHPTETGYMPSQSKSQTSSKQETKPQSGGSNGNMNLKDSGGFRESQQSFQIGDIQNSPPKDKLVHSTSTNPQTSLSNLPPLPQQNSNKSLAIAQKSVFSTLIDDNYEEDFSSESSGAGDEDLREKSGRSQEKKDGDTGPDITSTKDVISPAASVSEDLEGDANSVTEDINSAASALSDTLDSSLSSHEAKIADHMEEI